MNECNTVSLTETPVLKLSGLRHSYLGAQGPERSLHGINLSLGQGETLCLVGESGSGKTTCLRLINRLERAESGRVEVRGKDVLQWDLLRLRRSMGYVIQSGGLFPHMTVAQNVGLVCELEGMAPGPRAERVDQMLLAMELDPARFRSRYPAQLSGGQRQRVGVARAMALDPDLLLMDEPFGALDPLTRRKLQRSFLAAQAAQRRSVVLVTHDLDEAFALGDRIAILRSGRLEQVDTPAALLENPVNEYVQSLLQEMSHAR